MKLTKSVLSNMTSGISLAAKILAHGLPLKKKVHLYNFLFHLSGNIRGDVES